MKGRMSMEQAKAIRERRELAQELGVLLVCPLEFVYSYSTEDVQMFEKSVVHGASRGRNKATAKAESESEEERSENSEEDVPIVRKRKVCCSSLANFSSSTPRRQQDRPFKHFWTNSKCSSICAFCRLQVNFYDQLTSSALI